jgi:hypothetical protein
MSNPSNAREGIGFCGLLTLVLITLKLIHQIDWSWWWVLAPLWAVWLAAFAIVALLR